MTRTKALRTVTDYALASALTKGYIQDGIADALENDGVELPRRDELLVFGATQRRLMRPMGNIIPTLTDAKLAAGELHKLNNKAEGE